MLVYLIGFFISIFLLYISNKVDNKKIFYFIIIGCSLLIPCFIAGLRSDIVGTDVRVYVKPLFECAKRANNLKEYYTLGWSILWRVKYVAEFEYGFSFLVYIITKIFGNLQAVLFFIQLMTILPVYFGLKKFKKFKEKIWLGMLIYYFVFFCFSLNAMRQMIGVSIVFYAFSLLINENNKNLKFILFVIIATLFHKSSVLGLLIFFIYKILLYQKKRNLKIRIGFKRLDLFKVIIIFLIFIGVLLVFKTNFLLKAINILGFDAYSNYLSGDISFSKNQLILRLPILYLFLVQLKDMVKIDEKYLIFFIIFMLELLISNLSTMSIYASRIGIIFNFFNIISLIILSSCSTLKNRNRINSIIVISYSLLYWYYIYIYSGSCHVIPYVFY